MEKEFTPHQQSLDLKELGFDEPCFGTWDRPDKLWIGHVLGIDYTPDDTVLAPTFSQAFRWFREKYNLEGFVTPLFRSKLNISFENRKYDANILNGTKRFHKKGCETHEEANLECLKKLIEIVKQK